jgi:hypothetical protein
LTISFKKAFAGGHEEQPCEVKSSTTTGRSLAEAIAGINPRTKPSKTGMRGAIAFLQVLVSLTVLRWLDRLVTEYLNTIW